MGSQTRGDPSDVHDSAIEPVVRLSAQSRERLPGSCSSVKEQGVVPGGSAIVVYISRNLLLAVVCP